MTWNIYQVSANVGSVSYAARETPTSQQRPEKARTGTQFSAWDADVAALVTSGAVTLIGADSTKIGHIAPLLVEPFVATRAAAGLNDYPVPYVATGCSAQGGADPRKIR